MERYTQNHVRISMGLDLGDRFSYLLAMDREGTILAENKRLSTTRVAMEEYFSDFDPSETRIICEAGTHSPWVSALLERMGFEVVVANPSHAGRALAANGRKNDRVDALTLASLGFDSLWLLHPIKHRSKGAQSDLAIIRARDCAVSMRTQAINCVRGLVKSSSARLPSSSSASFHRKVLEGIPPELKPALLPLLEHIGQLTALIRAYDKEIENLAEKYPVTKKLRAIGGVGPLVSMAFVLTLEDPKRFRRSRAVGPFLGLVPKQHDSGESSPQLRITKAGNTSYGQ